MKQINFIFKIISVFSLVFFISSCSSDEETLNVPNNITFSVDNATISWDKIEGATSYEIEVEFINHTTSQAISSNNYEAVKGKTSLTIDTSILSDLNTKLSVRLRAYREEKTTKFLFISLGTTAEAYSDYSEKAIFSPMSKVSLDLNNDGTISWNAASNSTGYLISENGVEKSISNRVFEPKAPGVYEIKVKPTSSSGNFFSLWSETVTFEVLETVKNIDYDGINLTWDGVIGAKSYDVYIDGEFFSNSENPHIFFDSNNQRFNVSIETVGNLNRTFNSLTKASIQYEFLGNVSNINVLDGNLTWDSVQRATGYVVKIDNSNEIEVTSNTFTQLVANRSYSLSIKPITNQASYFSTYSDVFFVTILATPLLQWDESIQLNGESNAAIFWNGVANAVGYTVRVDLPNGQNIIETFGKDARNFSYDFLDEGEYTVYIKSLSQTNSDYYDSVYSLIPIKVIRLTPPSPTSSNHIVSDPEVLTKGVTINFLRVAQANSYQLFKDDILMTGESTTLLQFTINNLISSDVGEAQNNIYSIQSIGGLSVVNDQQVVKLNSLTRRNLAASITILPMPQNVQMVGYNLVWDNVGLSSNYVVSVSGTVSSNSTLSRDLSNLSAGVFEVKVAARGNGSNILPSNYTPGISVNRLQTPTNIKINTQDQAEGILTWDSVQNALSYNAIIDEQITQSVVNNQTNLSQFISNTGTTFHLISIGNYYQGQNPSTKTYYMTSRPSQTLQVTKLNAPTFGQFSLVDNSKLVWNAPSNLNTSTTAVSYNVYTSTGLLVASGLTVPNLDLTTLASGRSYTLSVKAIGDGVTLINSPVSIDFTFQKLAIPEVVRTQSAYTWNSVPGATSYSIFIDGVLSDRQINQVGSSFTFVPVFNELKTYQVQIYALGNGVDRVNSSAFELNQQTKQLTSPDFRLSYSEESVSETGKIVVTITTESPNNNGYVYTIGGVNYSGGSTYELSTNATGLYKIGVYAQSGTFDQNGVYYVRSNSVGNNDAYSINLLSRPTLSTVNLSLDGQLTWGSVTGALMGYEVEVAYNGSSTFIPLSKTTSTLLTVNLASYTSVKFRIRSMGNGNNLITSQWIEKEFFLN